jgi:hypothetical protein
MVEQRSPKPPVWVRFLLPLYKYQSKSLVADEMMNIIGL